jgi:hypothetical protein
MPSVTTVSGRQSSFSLPHGAADIWMNWQRAMFVLIQDSFLSGFTSERISLSPHNSMLCGFFAATLSLDLGLQFDARIRFQE